MDRGGGAVVTRRTVRGRPVSWRLLRGSPRGSVADDQKRPPPWCSCCWCRQPRFSPVASSSFPPVSAAERGPQAGGGREIQSCGCFPSSRRGMDGSSPSLTVRPGWLPAAPVADWTCGPQEMGFIRGARACSLAAPGSLVIACSVPDATLVPVWPMVET